MQVEQYKTISVERNGAVDTLWLNRPDAMNAITTPMVTELRHYFDHLSVVLLQILNLLLIVLLMEHLMHHIMLDHI